MTDLHSLLEPGETLLAEWRSDPARYWRDHLAMALLGAAAAALVLWLMDSSAGGILGGVAGAGLALLVRGLYLARPQMDYRWLLTDRRLILPHGGAVGLMEIETQRRLLGDVQLITRAGDKHLLKHLADAEGVLAALTRARAARAAA